MVNDPGGLLIKPGNNEGFISTTIGKGIAQGNPTTFKPKPMK